MEDFEKKVLQFFDKTIFVNKELLKFSDQFRKLPTFVIDFLISQMVDSNNPVAGLQDIDTLIRNHFISSDQKELIKSEICNRGSYVLIGKLQCRLDETRGIYWADINPIGNQIRIDHSILNKYQETLLTTGAWGTIKVVFDDNFAIRNRLFPFIVVDFKPIQVINVNVDNWIKNRENFSTEEWIDLLISSIGFDPAQLNREEKLLYLIRLIPFVESNVNLIELGPPETGKTFFYQSLSNYGFVLSGSNTTAASLFYNKLRKELGIVGRNDIVMFDEFAGDKLGGQIELIDSLKDYMNSGRFGRGTIEFSSGCSLVFGGNIDCDRATRSVRGSYRSYFDPLPGIVKRDRAFLDRIHGFIPGWKFPQIQEKLFSTQIGFMSDYLSEIMHRMRDKPYGHVLSRVSFGPMGNRSKVALMRLSSGLLKLIFPHKDCESVRNEELKLILDLSINLRQLILNQLSIISPGEFNSNKLEYTINV